MVYRPMRMCGLLTLNKGLRPPFSGSESSLTTPFDVKPQHAGAAQCFKCACGNFRALELGCEITSIQRALADFQRHRRRFQTVECELPDGGSVMLVDDYGHHPREIEATLAAVQEGWPGRRWCCVPTAQVYAYAGVVRDFVQVLFASRYVVVE